jgi:uncharacterized membrane protein
MMLGMIVFWGAVIALVVWALRSGIGQRRDDPLEILERHLADGSIGVEEYTQRRDALERARTAAP